MINEFDISKIDIPYGVLHDQSLKCVKCEDNKMIFTFDISVYPEDYIDDYYKQFVDFKHCDMTITMNEEPFNYYSFQTAINKKGKFEGLSHSREDFIEAINNATSATFIECSATYREFTVELAVSFKKKYGKYSLCYATIDAKKIEWKWY